MHLQHSVILNFIRKTTSRVQGLESGTTGLSLNHRLSVQAMFT